MAVNRLSTVFPGAGEVVGFRLPQAQLWQIMEDMPMWVQVCRLDGAVESVNRAASQISGYAASDLVGKAWPYAWMDLSEAGPGRNQAEITAWPYSQLSRNNGVPLEFEVACRTPQGETKPLWLTLSLLRAEDGRAQCVLLVAWDTTRRRRLDLEARRAEKLQAISQLASGVAHDINNNLAVILGYSEYLMTKLENPDEEVQEALSAIQTQSLECADTVRRIQLSVRPVARRHFSLVDVNEVVLEVAQGARSPEGDHSHPAVRVEAMLESVPQVQGHRSSLREALLSIINNGMDAMPAGGVVTLRTWRDGDSVAVAVTDEGVGIAASDLGRIFEPFFTTKGPSRSGLGLSIAYNLIVQQGGTIQVASQPGHGATLTVRLPVPVAVAEPPPARSAPPPRTALTVLVVDDEPQVAGVLEKFLTALGHQVVVRQDGPSALDTFQAQRFDLAVVDLGMPVMDGYELARRLNLQRPGFPILVATGWDVSMEDVKERGAVVRGVVKKPFSLKELAEAVNQATAVAV